VKARAASLGMYDDGDAAQANDRLWSVIARQLRDTGFDRVPDRVDRSRALDAIWDDPDLLLAQTCGYPFMSRWRERLRYVATIRYTAPGCVGAYHRSRFVVRAGDEATGLANLRGRRAAINDPMSNTGTNLFRAALAPLAQRERFFASVTETGSHRASLRLLTSGRCDVASIDCVTYAHIERQEPALVAPLRTLGWSTRTPGLPLVTARATHSPTSGSRTISTR
jgi:ABC-type phosphate/phosphonate transport system substrate-binding protein